MFRTSESIFVWYRNVTLNEEKGMATKIHLGSLDFPNIYLVPDAVWLKKELRAMIKKLKLFDQIPSTQLELIEYQVQSILE